MFAFGWSEREADHHDAHIVVPLFPPKLYSIAIPVHFFFLVILGGVYSKPKISQGRGVLNPDLHPLPT